MGSQGTLQARRPGSDSLSSISSEKSVLTKDLVITVLVPDKEIFQKLFQQRPIPFQHREMLIKYLSRGNATYSGTIT